MNRKGFLTFFRTVFCGLFVLSALAFVGCSSKDDQPVENEKTQETAARSPAPTQQPAVKPVIVPPPAADGNVTVVSTDTGTGTKISAADVLAKFAAADTVSLKIELLESLGDSAAMQDPDVIPVVQKAVSDPSAEVSRTAVALLIGYDSPAIIPAVSQAIKSSDEQTRRDAVELLLNVDDPQVATLIVGVLDDASEEVRSSALVLAAQQEGDAAITIMKHGIGSQFADVRETVVAMLQNKGDRQAVDILITGIKNNNAEVNDEINAVLELLIDKRFETHEQAAAWWTQNKDKYNDDMTPKEN